MESKSEEIKATQTLDISSIKTDSDQLIRLAVEASPNGMIMSDDNGQIVLVNSATESMFGYQREELIGQFIEKLIPERFQAHHPSHRANYNQSPLTRAMGQGRELYGLRKDGSEFPIEIGLNPAHTEFGLYVLAAVVDITDRKHAEQMMKLAVEASPNGMLLTNAEGEIVLVNSKAEKIFGYERAELIGMSINNLVPEKYRTAHPSLRANYLKSPNARAMGQGRDLFGLHKDGIEIPVEIGLNPINTKNETMILASVVDITERKRHESMLLAALHEKEILLAEIHHRVKNNLQIIDSLLGIQSDKVSDPNARSVLIECQGRVQSMAIIHQTLYESKDFSSVRLDIVINTLLENLGRSYLDSISELKQEITVEDIKLPISTSIPLGLILNELCSNVMKHAYQPGQTGILRVRFFRKSKDLLMLEVEDEGKGLPENFNHEQSNSMGLMLVHVLSEQIGAKLEISSKGPTRFRLSFIN